MASPDDHAPSSLPLWIAVACCAAAAMLVFGNTMPAMQERSDLELVEAELEGLMRRYEQDTRVARLSGARGTAAQPLDLQSLFVAIDQKGYTIAEFCAAYPAEKPADKPAEPAGAPR